MTTTPKKGPTLLWAWPALVVPVAFIAAIWVTRPPMMVVTIAAAAVVIFMMSYANYLSYRVMSRLDEVQKAGAAFAAQWGAPAGQALFGLLLVLPPFKDLATGVVRTFLRTFVFHPIVVDETVVVLSLGFGFMALVFLEAIGRVVVHAIWWTARR